MPSEPTLQELIDKWIELLEEIIELLEKRIKAKAARNLQAQRTSDGANIVSGWGTLSETNPSDETIDGWDASQVDAFATACKARCQELEDPG